MNQVRVRDTVEEDELNKIRDMDHQVAELKRTLQEEKRAKAEADA